MKCPTLRCGAAAVLLSLCAALAAGCGEADGVSESPGETTSTGGVDGKADIYGEDSRVEVFEASAALQQVARATALIVDTSALYIGDDREIWMRGASWSDRIRQAEGAPLCATERFREQPAPGFCSGFLIAPDLVATAGHCVNMGHTCEDIRFVFGYAYKQSAREDDVRRVTSENLYRCDAVVGHVYDRDAATVEDLTSKEYWSDWAVVRLDRPVVGREPLPLRRSGKPAVGASVTTVGYPGGIPAKATSGRIVGAARELYFNTDLDIYGGNSGGVVVNRQGDVEGIVIRGTGGKSFHREGTCMASDTCEAYTGTGACTGNHAQRIDPVLQFTDTSRVVEAVRAEAVTVSEGAPGVIELEITDPGTLRYVTLNAVAYTAFSADLRISIERVGGGAVALFDRSTLHKGYFSRSTEAFSGQPAAGRWRVRVEDVVANGSSSFRTGRVQLLLGIGEPVKPQPEQTFIGSACASDADCGFASAATCRRHSDGAHGFCVLPCEGYCPDRAGFATTFCAPDGEGGGACVSRAHAANQWCDAMSGTEAQDLSRFIGQSSAREATATVCAPTAP